ncbi:MAG: ribosomal RNA small subunit methyltransferase A [Candidatus Omnitrophota bacterium]|nr:MAG: ribosomal RNA small subunit methyltransferase A [Candidatus Omnitrophota bacterium]
MLTKSELKALWKSEDFRPLKRLGQNFLIDKNVKDKILRNLELDPEDTLIEIGTGFGELTFDLAKSTGAVFAIEKDRKIVVLLKNIFELPPNVTLIEEDFLDVDIKKIATHKKIIIYGNIPYYITSPIIEKLFDNISLIKDIYLVVQREIADRMLAMPGTRDMGRLSLYVQYYTEPKRLFKIKRESFYPVPQVESVFLKLAVLKKKKAYVKDENLFFKIIKNAYSQRRKAIRNSLSAEGLDKEALSRILNRARLNPSARAEDLSLLDFARLANEIANGT